MDRAEAMWPTPTSLSFDTSHQPGNNRNQNKTMDLVSKMWPTPDAFVSNDGESPETFEAHRAKVKESAQNGNGMGTPLAMACKMWPTPVHSEARQGFQDRSTGKKGTQESLSTIAVKSSDSLLAPTTAKAGPTGSPKAVLNPAFVEALMGFPPAWTAFAPSETPSSHKSRRSRLLSSGDGTGSEADGE